MKDNNTGLLFVLLSKVDDVFCNHFLLFLTRKSYHGTNPRIFENKLASKLTSVYVIVKIGTNTSIKGMQKTTKFGTSLLLSAGDFCMGDFQGARKHYVCCSNNQAPEKEVKGFGCKGIPCNAIYILDISRDSPNINI